MARQFYFDAWHYLLLRELTGSKDSRIAEARVRQLSFGCELRFIADGLLRSSEVFRGEGGELSDRALARRHDFERLGWQVVS